MSGKSCRTIGCHDEPGGVCSLTRHVARAWTASTSGQPNPPCRGGAAFTDRRPARGERHGCDRRERHQRTDRDQIHGTSHVNPLRLAADDDALVIVCATLTGKSRPPARREPHRPRSPQHGQEDNDPRESAFRPPYDGRRHMNAVVLRKKGPEWCRPQAVAHREGPYGRDGVTRKECRSSAEGKTAMRPSQATPAARMDRRRLSPAGEGRPIPLRADRPPTDTRSRRGTGPP